jgi:hypothetical protein
LQAHARARGVQLEDGGSATQWCCGFTFLDVKFY